MEHTIELPPGLTVIDRTEATNRMVHDTAMKEILPVETLWGIANGHLAVGWHVMDPERTKTMRLWAVTNNVNDPVQTYRAYRIAQQTKIVSRAGLNELARVFHHEEVEGAHDCETRLLRDVGPRNFGEIRTAIDPQFEQHFQTIIGANVPIYLGSIYAEVDAGRIIPTVGLRMYGIMPMAERDAAKRRLDQAIAGWTPHFEAFAEQFGHGPACVQTMITGAAYSRWKGVEDVSLQVGLGILSHHEQHRQIALRIGALAEHLGAMLGAMGIQFGRPAGSLDEDVTQISSFLAARFRGADAFQHACALRDYWGRLPGMPTDRSI